MKTTHIVPVLAAFKANPSNTLPPKPISGWGGVKTYTHSDFLCHWKMERAINNKSPL